MSGVSKERLNLNVEDNSLLIEGALGIVPQEQQMTALDADVRATAHRRSFLLSNELETGKIDANLKEGVLTIHRLERAERRPRRIDVQC